MQKEPSLPSKQQEAATRSSKPGEGQPKYHPDNKKDSAINIGDTPVVETNKTGTLLKKEAHDLTVIKWTEELKKNVEAIRKEIISHYNIPESNVFIDDFPEGKQRPLRLFIVMLHKDNPKLNVYAEGSIYHAYLYNLIRDKLEGNTLPTREYLAKNIVKILNGEDESFPFVLHKGFIDIYKNGFQNFPAIREALEKQSKERGGQPITNWFKSN